MYNTLALIQVADDVGVINEQRGCGFQFHTAIQAAEALNPAHQSLAAGHVVAHADSDDDLLPGLHEVSDVVFVGAAVAGVVAHVGAVDPEPALRMYAADLEPDLLACPRFRQSQFLAVPAGPHVRPAQRANAALRCDGCAIARAADTLRFPATGDLERDCLRQRD